MNRNRTAWWVLLGIVLWTLSLGSYGAPRAAAAPYGLAGPALRDTVHDNGLGERVRVRPTEDKAQLRAFYQRPYIRNYYGRPTTRPLLPAFDYNQSLRGKSYRELVLLRNTIYARNGYCFMNPIARAYFIQQEWYRPVWGEIVYNDYGHVTQPVDSIIPVPLNQQERAFVQRVHAEEVKQLAHRLSRQDGYDLLGLDFVTNLSAQDVTPTMHPVLARHNFVLVPRFEEQLFGLYKDAEEDYTPIFVTTDLVLQLLHKYLNGILNDVEARRLVPVVATMLRTAHTQAEALARHSRRPPARAAAEWAAAYYAVGQGLLTPGSPAATGAYAELAAQALARATAAEGLGSPFLGDSLYDYAALRPRGSYTRDDTTRQYFRTVRWLNTAPLYLDSDAGLLRVVALAQALAADSAGTRSFRQFSQVLDVLVGDEDNRSMTHLLHLLRTQYAGRTLDQLARPAVLARLRQQLVATGTDRVRPDPATTRAGASQPQRPQLLFTAGRYTLDAEILRRLAQGPRLFPKGLDVFATFGNQTAQDVLLQHYQEAQRWPAYPDTLRQLQQQLGRFRGWDQNLYTKTMQMLLALNAPSPDQNLPLFARTPAWQKRNLSTALGGWAELKHDLILYAEQTDPMAGYAENGHDGPPPPQHLGYVEPNLPFWNAALDLLRFQEQRLTRLNANTEHLAWLNKNIRELVTRLRDLAQKEVNHQPLTYAETERLSWIGGEVHSLTLRILKVDELPDSERHIGLVADVYASGQEVLEEAVGAADALYVVVEINGAPVLARGAVFSYYEFTSPTRLTDEEWQQRLPREAPPRPGWLQEFIAR